MSIVHGPLLRLSRVRQALSHSASTVGDRPTPLIVDTRRPPHIFPRGTTAEHLGLTATLAAPAGYMPEITLNFLSYYCWRRMVATGGRSAMKGVNMEDDNDTISIKAKKLLEPQGPLIFLSYAKEDKEKVRSVYRRLRIERLNPWLDVADLLPGEDWERVIVKVIRSARYVLVFLSNNSVNKRGYVQKEIKEALDAADRVPEGEIFIIPVRLEACPVPERLSRWQWIDIFRPNGLKQIVTTLKENLSTEQTGTSASRIHPKLIIIGETDMEALFNIKRVVSVIGRADASLNIIPDVDLKRFDPHRTVSRTHALLFRHGNSFIIKDCGSTNGTRINDSILLRENQTRVLNAGDKIKLGDIVLRFIIVK